MEQGNRQVTGKALEMMEEGDGRNTTGARKRKRTGTATYSEPSFPCREAVEKGNEAVLSLLLHGHHRGLEGRGLAGNEGPRPGMPGLSGRRRAFVLPVPGLASSRLCRMASQEWRV